MRKIKFNLKSKQGGYNSQYICEAENDSDAEAMVQALFGQTHWWSRIA